MIKQIIGDIVNDVINIYNDLASLQKRKNKYDIKDIFRMLMDTMPDNKAYNRYTFNHNLNLASPGNLSYWTVKIYNNIDLSNLYNSYYNDYVTDPDNHNKNYINDNNNNIYDPSHLYNKYVIYSCDGTNINCSIKNENGKNISSINMSTLIDISNNLIYSNNIAFDCNEQKALLKHSLSKSNIVIVDRLYSDPWLLKKISNYTNFVVRLKKNFKFVKKFMASNKSEDIINVGKLKLKIIKYYVDRTTRNKIVKKYNEDDVIIDEDKDKVFIVATNILSLNIADCIYLYNRRWTSEVVFRYLKSNFNIRHIVKETNIKNPISKLNFWIDLSLYLYNITTIIKNISDKNTNKNCRFSKCSQNIINIFMNKNDTNSQQEYCENICDKILKTCKRFVNNRDKNLTDNSRLKKKGKYKSFNTITNNNKYFIDDFD
jgi:hypothetical protein